MEKAAKTGIAILLYLLLFALAADTARADAPDPCALFTKGEAEALMGMETASVRQSDAVSPAGRVCTYFFKKDGGTFDAKLRTASDGEIAAEGIYGSASDVFSRQTEARKKHEYASGKYRELEAPGAEAFWSGSSLWALKGGLLLIITANPPLGGSFASTEEANAAKEEKSLEISLKILETVLGKLP